MVRIGTVVSCGTSHRTFAFWWRLHRISVWEPGQKGRTRRADSTGWPGIWTGRPGCQHAPQNVTAAGCGGWLIIFKRSSFDQLNVIQIQLDSPKLVSQARLRDHRRGRSIWLRFWAVLGPSSMGPCSRWRQEYIGRRRVLSGKKHHSTNWLDIAIGRGWLKADKAVGVRDRKRNVRDQHQPRPFQACIAKDEFAGPAAFVAALLR